MTQIKDVKTINLPKFLDTRGNLSVVEQLQQVPFKIKRTYWIYDVPGGEIRGGHAYIKEDYIRDYEYFINFRQATVKDNIGKPLTADSIV